MIIGTNGTAVHVLTNSDVHKVHGLMDKPMKEQKLFWEHQNDVAHSFILIFDYNALN